MNNEAKTHVIDGKTFVEVSRKARVGEKVVAVKYVGQSTKPGDILTCVCNDEYDDGSIDAETSDGYVKFFDSDIDEYRVLVPQDQAPTSTDDLIANLIRRVAALERANDSLESQLRDTQNNVERQGVEIANIEAATKAPQSGAKLLAEAFEALAKYERSVGR